MSKAAVSGISKSNGFRYAFRTSNPEQTIQLGKRIGASLKKGDVVCLTGELGAGKTTVIKGIVQGTGIDDYVTSPSFKLINEYGDKLPVYHFDLYRLEGIESVEDLGYEEYFYGRGITLVEWAEKMSRLLPVERFEIKIVLAGDNNREITVSAPREMKL